MSVEDYADFGRGAALAWCGPIVELHAFAMPRCGPQAEPVVHIALRAPGMVMNYNMPLEPARKAHARLGAALRAFDLARELAGDVTQEAVGLVRHDTRIREQERLYRAKLSVRLGLAEDDIRAVFDLSDDEMALLRAEVAVA